MTIGKRGVRATIGVPGTGLSYTEHTRWEDPRLAASPSASPPTELSPELQNALNASTRRGCLWVFGALAAALLVAGLLGHSVIMAIGLIVTLAGCYSTWTATAPVETTAAREARFAAERQILSVEAEATAREVARQRRVARRTTYADPPVCACDPESMPPGAARRYRALVNERDAIAAIRPTADGRRRVRAIDAELTALYDAVIWRTGAYEGGAAQ